MERTSSPSPARTEGREDSVSLSLFPRIRFSPPVPFFSLVHSFSPGWVEEGAGAQGMTGHYPEGVVGMKTLLRERVRGPVIGDRELDQDHRMELGPENVLETVIPHKEGSR